MRLTALMIQALIATAAAGALAAPALDESSKDVIAAQIRDQGYTCDTPQSATRDEQASRPDEAVWILQCETAKYRVRLDPDMAAKVERIDQ